MYAIRCMPGNVFHLMYAIKPLAMDMFHLIMSNGVSEYIVHSRQDAIILTEMDTICK
jgi:hypothetical protein